MSTAGTPDANGTPWSGRSIGASWGWRICAWCIRRFGRWPAYALVTPILGYYFLFAGATRGARRASDEFLGRAMGVAGPLRGTWRSFHQFHTYALSLVDRYLLLLRGPSAFDLQEEGRGAVERAVRAGRGLVLVTSHLGNTDLAGAVLAGDEVPTSAVRYQAERPEIQQLFESIGGGPMPEVIDIRGDGPVTLRILGALRQGRIVGMMGDRVVDGYWVDRPFLGHTAAFPAGPFLVAALARVPLVVAFCLRRGVRAYRVEVLPPRELSFERGRPRGEQLEEWVGEFVEALEQRVRSHPFQWANFYSVWARDGLPERASTDRVRGGPASSA